ncbi:hypothetical protein ABIF86_004496 [Bradyrhizobium japonicum]
MGSWSQRLFAGLGRLTAWIGRATRFWFWQGLAALLAVCLIIAVVRPFASQPSLEADDIAASWNQSIARLGILPIFPPAEDFYVGDVWAVITNAEEAPLLGKAVRVAHLDLRKDLEIAQKQRPVFATTANTTPTASTKPVEDASDHISLTLAAFPGLTITHAKRAAGSLGWHTFGFGSSRDDQELEEIRIPVAETYGVPYAEAFVRLDEWCLDPNTKLLCSDGYLRRLLAYSIGDRILAARNGKYLAQLQLSLVTRVFLTRTIEQRRLIATGGDVTLRTTRPSSAPTSNTGKSENSTLGERASDEGGDRLENAKGTDPNAIPSATITSSRKGGSEIEVHRSFPRPVAFGFRAVSIAVPLSEPRSESQR